VPSTFHCAEIVGSQPILLINEVADAGLAVMTVLGITGAVITDDYGGAKWIGAIAAIAGLRGDEPDIAFGKAFDRQLLQAFGDGILEGVDVLLGFGVKRR
jgi:hypothetical protein